MLEIRDALALPGRFQAAYDMRVRARLPLDAEILYLEGAIAPQCEHRRPAPCGHVYEGGGEQIYLPEPQQVEIAGRKCAASSQVEAPAWERCSSIPQFGCTRTPESVLAAA